MDIKIKKINKGFTPELNETNLVKKSITVKLVRGFTLIEIMVAMSIFTLIMVMSSGSILSVFDANQKSKNLRSVMDNLNLTLESMTRTIRFGTKYHCGSGGTITDPNDCGGAGSDTLTVQSEGQSITYSLSGNRIVRTILGVPSFVTSSDVTITRLDFRVFGSLPYVNGAGACPGANDCLQPRVVIVVSGYVGNNVGSKTNLKSSFTLQTTVSQRKFNFE